MLERSPYDRGRAYMSFGHSGTKLAIRNRGIRITAVQFA